MLFVQEDDSKLQERIEELERLVRNLEHQVQVASPVRVTLPGLPSGSRRPIPVGRPVPVGLPSNMNEIKLCPAKKGNKADDSMLPCELYGIEVDVSQQGIWFDGRATDGQEEELISVLRRIDKSAASTIKNLFKNPSWAEQLKERIRIARGKAAEYAAAVAKLEGAEKRRADAEQKADRASNDPVAMTEYHNATKEFQDLAATERSLSVDAKVNITPGFVENEQPQEKAGADPSGESPKGCPAKPRERMIKMEILEVTLDVSPTGIWFDGVVGNRTKPELVELLEKFKDSNTGPLSFFKNFERQKVNFNAKIAERVALISKLTEVYNSYSVLMKQARFHPGTSDLYKHFKVQADVKFQEFAQLSAAQKKPVKL